MELSLEDKHTSDYDFIQLCALRQSPIASLLRDSQANQMADGEPQMAFHLPFALCHLNFEFLLGCLRSTI
jgi:hypothetical protein